MALASPPVALIAVVTAIKGRSAAAGVKSLRKRQSSLRSFYEDYFARELNWSEADARFEADLMAGNLRDVIQKAHFDVEDPGELVAFGGMFAYASSLSFSFLTNCVLAA
jgi:hypothetical protein